ncbi:MAG: histidine phosphatase family protein [Comamonadaceae bacterium]|nr:histidine phosphatase family protein [Comamonadaceae bacterium]
MRELRLWLVRHGQSTANAGAPASDPLQTPLTSLGLEQARAAALQVGVAPDLLVASPMRRAAQTADALHARWPETSRETWPISEFTYLSPPRCIGTTGPQRSEWVSDYWDRCLPEHVDGEGAESFAAFMSRVRDFHDRATARGGFIVAVGHGQFFRAYAWARSLAFAATPETMREFRRREVADPMRNGEIVKIPS